MIFDFIQIIGLLGGFCFAACGVPAAYATFMNRGSIGTPISTAWMITLGAILMYTYLYVSYGFDPIISFNYFIEIASWGTIVFYHYK